MCRSAIYLALLIIFIVAVVLVVHNDKTFMNYIEKIKNESAIQDCCIKGSYDTEINTCVGTNGEKYEFAFPCKELLSIHDLDLEEDDPEDVIK